MMPQGNKSFIDFHVVNQLIRVPKIILKKSFDEMQGYLLNFLLSYSVLLALAFNLVSIAEGGVL